MDISEKQAVWREQKPLFEAEFIHSHLLPFFTFNENTGDYEIKSECVNNTDDEDRKVAYEALNTGWVMWLRAKRDAKAQAVPEGRTDSEIIDQTIQLVDLLASANRFQRDKSKPLPFESKNPRNMEWWRLACQIQELITNTDPNNCDFEEYKAMIEVQEPANDSP